MRATILTTFALIACCCGTIQAQEGGGFAIADADNDKKVSKQELEEYLSERLPEFERLDELVEKLDEDKDGSISSSEFENRFEAIQGIGMGPKPDQDKPEMKEKDSEKEDEESGEEGEAKEAPPKKEVVEFAEMYERRFANANPKLGSEIKDVSAFDEKGKEFKLHSVKGKHTVIVFGCLT